MRHASVIFAVLSVLVLLAGCGSNTPLTEPVVRNAQITTTPTPLTNAGGPVTLNVDILYPPSNPNTTLPILGPVVEVRDASGASPFTFPRGLGNSPNTPNLYTSTFTLPGNAGGAAPKVYTLSVVPHGLAGGSNIPTVVGTVTVPN